MNVPKFFVLLPFILTSASRDVGRFTFLAVFTELLLALSRILLSDNKVCKKGIHLINLNSYQTDLFFVQAEIITTPSVTAAQIL